MPALGSSDRMPALALLAGGLATRLRPLTLTVPKSLIEVAGDPFVAHQLRSLARQEITDIVICAGHLGEQIAEYVGDGTRFGCSVRYSFDGDRPLGTGGALRKAMRLLAGFEVPERFYEIGSPSGLDATDAFLRRLHGKRQ